jgi:biopolymer transport protein ExbD
MVKDVLVIFLFFFVMRYCATGEELKIDRHSPTYKTVRDNYKVFIKESIKSKGKTNIDDKGFISVQFLSDDLKKTKANIQWLLITIQKMKIETLKNALGCRIATFKARQDLMQLEEMLKTIEKIERNYSVRWSRV